MIDVDDAPVVDPAVVAGLVMSLWRKDGMTTFEIAMALEMAEAEVAEIIHASRERQCQVHAVR